MSFESYIKGMRRIREMKKFKTNFALAGAVAGVAVIGVRGIIPIPTEPIVSMLYGAIIGGIVGYIFISM